MEGRLQICDEIDQVLVSSQHRRSSVVHGWRLTRSIPSTGVSSRGTAGGVLFVPGGILPTVSWWEKARPNRASVVRRLPNWNWDSERLAMRSSEKIQAPSTPRSFPPRTRHSPLVFTRKSNILLAWGSLLSPASRLS